MAYLHVPAAAAALLHAQRPPAAWPADSCTCSAADDRSNISTFLYQFLQGDGQQLLIR
eukprot:COSAG01_NODE_6915_length_3441_cov_6.296230_2_plen_58_part_00